jgi:hypothetical protein
LKYAIIVVLGAGVLFSRENERQTKVPRKREFLMLSFYAQKQVT